MPGVRRKILIGFGVALGILLVAAAVIFFIGWRWFHKEAELEAGAHPLLTGEESRYYTVTLDIEDEGIRALLVLLVEELSEQDMPPQMALVGGILDTVKSQGTEEALGGYLPIRFADLRYPPGPDTPGGMVQAVGLSKSYQVLVMFAQQNFQRGAQVSDSYREHPIYVRGAGAQAVVENVLLQGGPPDVVRGAMDRLLDQPSPVLPPEGERLGNHAGRLSDTTDAWGFVLGTGERMHRLYRTASQGGDEEVAGYVRMTRDFAFAADFVSAERADVRFAITFLEPLDETRRLVAGRSLTRGIAALIPPPLQLDLSPSWEEDDTLILQGQVSGLSDLVRMQVQGIFQRMRMMQGLPTQAPPQP